MIPKTYLLSFLLIGAGAVSQAAPGDAVFHRYDADGDKVVTAEELPDAATRARFDRDGDGSVTLAEFRGTAGLSAPASNSFEPAKAKDRLDTLVEMIDADGDGAISRDEAGDGRWFKKIDRNQDDVVDAAELELVRALVKRLGEGILPSVPDTGVSSEVVAEVTSGPEILKPGDVGIGRMIPDVSFTTIDGKTNRLGEVQEYGGAVIAMTSATCPVSKRYLPVLADLEARLAEQNIALVIVNPFSSETEEEIRAQLAEYDFRAPYVHDKDQALSAALGAATTTEVFFIDSKRTLLYRGAIDDRYGIDYSHDEARHEYLLDALGAFLDGEAISIAATKAPGCELDLGDATSLATAGDITYHRDVARILQQNCVRCHHDDGIGPFALDNIDDVTDRAKVIKRVVSEGTMPPWFAAPPEDGGPSPWVNDHSLSERDKADLLAWLESSDKPVGDPSDAPDPLVFSSEWSIGKPDLVVELSKAYTVKADGFMPYQYDIVETELAEDKWVSAYEVLPTARDVVHHVIIQVFEKDAEVKRGGEGSTGYWAAYVPGNGKHEFPAGFARKIPAGAKVMFQIHYTPSGTEREDRLKLGLVFAEEKPSFEVRTLPLADRQLNIPPGAAAHVEGASRRIPYDVPVTSFMAHMHVRGSAFKYEVEYPDGETETLLDIPRYDFNWQLRYDLKEPKMIPRGSTLKVTGVFDNSENNRANPDPTKTVKWGDQTVDEMLIGYVEYFVPITGEELAAAD